MLEKQCHQLNPSTPSRSRLEVSETVQLRFSFTVPLSPKRHGSPYTTRINSQNDRSGTIEGFGIGTNVR